MTKSVFTAVDPNGVTHKRTSENRTYTHTVVYQMVKAAHLANATGKGARDAHARNAAYYLDCVRDGQHTELNRKFPAQMTAERNAKDVAESLARLAGCTTVEAFVDMRVAEAVAKIEATDWTVWHNAGWCGRPDLAQKLAAKFPGARILDAVKQ